MRLIWADKALSDLESVRAYVNRDNPGAARTIVLQILKLASDLTHYPEMGRTGIVPGTRELVVSNMPYIIPYRVREGAVEILRVLHSSRNWPEEL